MRLHIWALAALAGVGALAGSARAQSDPQEVVATVNGRSITMGEVEAALKVGEVKVPPFGPERSRIVNDMACRLIDGAVWEEYLKKNGSRVSKSEIDKRFAELEKTVKDSGHVMAQYYAESGQTEAQVRAGIASVLQWEAIAKGKISDADVKRYYEQNRDFFDGVHVSARHIIMRVPANATAAQKQEVVNNLRAVRAHIVAGTFDFAEAAKRYCQDDSAKDGGNLGTVTRHGGYPENFLRAAFALPLNTPSDVVESEFGLHLILVTKRTYAPETVSEQNPNGRAPDYEQIKGQVRAVCAEELRHSVMEQLRTAAKVKFN
jgi:parvulin-like peptidyl-prolyl isomerase